MTAEINRLYRRFRAAGYRPVDSMRDARTVAEFREIETADDDLEPEDIGAVRIVQECDDNEYDPGDMLEPHRGSDGRWRTQDELEKELNCILETYGVWIVSSQVWTGTDWETVDSIGGCAGYDDPCSPFENCYVPDLMRAAIEASRELTSDIVALP